MNEQRMDDLISGLTRGTESKPVLPRHTDNTGNTSPECRFCTIVDKGTLQKIRIIAKREGLQIKEVVGAAFEKAISSYESRHGRIVGSQQSRVDSLF